MSHPIIIFYAANERLGILQFNLPNKGTVGQIDTTTTQPKPQSTSCSAQQTPIIPFLDCTSQDQFLQDHINNPFQDHDFKTPIKTTLLKPSLKTTVSEPISDITRHHLPHGSLPQVIKHYR